MAEYRAIFALTDADLRGRILDCPGGGAAFTATACAGGATAIAADPAFASPVADIAAHVAAEVERSTAWAQANAHRYRWDFYGDVDGHGRVRGEAARLFTADLHAHPERYVAASLPDLPFADDSFDLVLSSHLLFTYSDRLDRAFHRAALLELARVSRGQVRAFPLVSQIGRPETELVEQVMADLAAADVRASIRAVDYDFEPGAGSMLVLDP